MLHKCRLAPRHTRGVRCSQKSLTRAQGPTGAVQDRGKEFTLERPCGWPPVAAPPLRVRRPVCRPMSSVPVALRASPCYPIFRFNGLGWHAPCPYSRSRVEGLDG
jgi:hypothetical protein